METTHGYVDINKLSANLMSAISMGDRQFFELFMQTQVFIAHIEAMASFN